MPSRYGLRPVPDVLTIGNALVDVLDHEDDEFLSAHDLVKGSMHLVDAARAGEIYDAMGPGIEMSGGCAANTAAGIVSLGATAADLRRLVIGAALRPVAIGTAAGLIGAWWTARFLQAFVFEVDARSPWTFGAVALVLAVTAVLAAWRPAQRAATTDPTTVLRAL